MTKAPPHQSATAVERSPLSRADSQAGCGCRTAALARRLQRLQVSRPIQINLAQHLKVAVLQCHFKPHTATQPAIPSNKQVLDHRSINTHELGQPGCRRCVLRRLPHGKTIDHGQRGRRIEPMPIRDPAVDREHRHRQPSVVQPDRQQMGRRRPAPARRQTRHVAPPSRRCCVPEQVQVPMLRTMRSMGVVEKL